MRVHQEFYDPLSGGALSDDVLKAKRGGRNRGVRLALVTYRLEQGYGTRGKYGAPFSFDEDAVSDAVVAAPNLKFLRDGHVARVWGSRDDLVAYIDYNFGDGYAHTAARTSVEAGNWIALADMVRTWPKVRVALWRGGGGGWALFQTPRFLGGTHVSRSVCHLCS